LDVVQLEMDILQPPPQAVDHGSIAIQAAKLVEGIPEVNLGIVKLSKFDFWESERNLPAK
jgi:hypothetical protein